MVYALDNNTHAEAAAAAACAAAETPPERATAAPPLSVTLCLHACTAAG